MSHFPIIQLCETRQEAKDGRISPSDLYDDATVNYFTDYVWDEYTEEERRNFIHGEDLRKMFDGVAKVTKSGHITFFDKETILKARKEETERILDKLLKRRDEGRLRIDDFKYDSEDWRGYTAIFYPGYAQMSGSFFDDAHYYAGKELWIGAVIDAHY